MPIYVRICMYMYICVCICTYMFVAYQCNHSLKRINLNNVGWSKPCVGQRVSQSLRRRRRGRWIRSCTQCPAAPPATGRQIQVRLRVSQSWSGSNLKFTLGQAMQGRDGAAYDALSARRIQVHTMMPAARHSVPGPSRRADSIFGTDDFPQCHDATMP